MATSLFKTLVLSSSLALVLVGCGGGDEGSSSSSSTTSNATSSTSSTTTSKTVQTTTPSGALSVMDAGGVAGLEVKCSSGGSTTEIGGGFSCSKFPATVYLGSMKLGEVKTVPYDNTLYTQDILGVSRGATAHADVTKLSMILQSLDDDAQPLNGITLAEDTRSILSAHLSSNTKISDMSFEDVEYIITDVIDTRLSQDEKSKLQAVNATTAQSNLTLTTAKAPALTYSQRAPGRSL